MLREGKLTDINEERLVTNRIKVSQRRCLMLAKHFTIKSLLEILCDTERAKDQSQKLVEIFQGIEKMPCVHHKLYTRKIRQALFKLFLIIFYKEIKQFLMFIIFYITMY